MTDKIFVRLSTEHLFHHDIINSPSNVDSQFEPMDSNGRHTKNYLGPFENLFEMNIFIPSDFPFDLWLVL